MRVNLLKLLAMARLVFTFAAIYFLISFAHYIFVLFKRKLIPELAKNCVDYFHRMSPLIWSILLKEWRNNQATKPSLAMFIRPILEIIWSIRDVLECLILPFLEIILTPLLSGNTSMNHLLNFTYTFIYWLYCTEEKDLDVALPLIFEEINAIIAKVIVLCHFVSLTNKLYFLLTIWSNSENR